MKAAKLNCSLLDPKLDLLTEPIGSVPMHTLEIGKTYRVVQQIQVIAVGMSSLLTLRQKAVVVVTGKHDGMCRIVLNRTIVADIRLVDPMHILMFEEVQDA